MARPNELTRDEASALARLLSNAALSYTADGRVVAQLVNRLSQWLTEAKEEHDHSATR